MKTTLIATLLLAALTLIPSSRADDADSGTSLVTNNHGGYNTVQNGVHRAVIIPFFGFNGFAAHVHATSKQPKSYLIHPVVQGTGHDQHTVYHKVQYASPADAEAAKMAQ
jgi:hypothetical protein